MDDGSIEHRFIEGTVLGNNYDLHEHFQEEVSRKIRDFLKREVFGKWHLAIIELVKKNPKVSNQELATALAIARKERIDELNKEIIEKLERYLGLHFKTMREAVAGLSKRNYL